MLTKYNNKKKQGKYDNLPLTHHTNVAQHKKKSIKSRVDRIEISDKSPPPHSPFMSTAINSRSTHTKGTIIS